MNLFVKRLKETKCNDNAVGVRLPFLAKPWFKQSAFQRESSFAREWYVCDRSATIAKSFGDRKPRMTNTVSRGRAARKKRGQNGGRDVSYFQWNMGERHFILSMKHGVLACAEEVADIRTSLLLGVLAAVFACRCFFLLSAISHKYYL